ncbi:MAG: transglutaminase-like domain-containing protein [Candidatus Hermodarchaeota archaeon]
MSSEEKLGRDPAPAAIRYLVLLSAFTSLLTIITFLPNLSGASTQEQNFFQSAIPGFAFLFLISIVEWFVLRRSRKIFTYIANVVPFVGPYGFALGVEVLKSLLLILATNYYIQQVEGASSSTFLLQQLTSYAIIIGLVVTKVARTRLEQLAEKKISKHVLNLLPTFLVLALFLGTYLTEITGLGTPRQRSSFEAYTEKDIDWSLYNTPGWDATYLLENLLDQFTLGLGNLQVPLFNVSYNGPVTYWRLRSLESYVYTGKAPYSTDWRETDEVKRVLSPIATTPNTTYSRIVPESQTAYNFTVSVPLNHSTTLGDVTINQNFVNYLPTTWNGGLGSYISSNDFKLYDAEDNDLIPTTAQAREVFPNLFSEDLLGIEANLQLNDISNQRGRLEYIMTYKSMNQTIQRAIAYSLKKDAYSTILDAPTWAAIQTLYLQLPNHTGTLPNPCYVQGDSNIPNLDNQYWRWAPNVTYHARNWTYPYKTVFNQAYFVMKQFSLNGSQGFAFDNDTWMAQQLGQTVVADHPEQYEDFNEWFFNRKKGVSLHFASTFATIMRLQGIPCRVVIGYIPLNDTRVSYKGLDRRVIYSSGLHAWAEVLVPLDTLPGVPGGESVEWISFDPLFAGNVPDLQDEQALTIRPDYDLEGRGIAQALLDDNDFRTNGSNDWIFWRCTVNHSGLYDPSVQSSYPLLHGDKINLSVRLILQDGATWIPPYESANISFYVGISGENSSGIFIDYSLTDEYGFATIQTTIDVTRYGVRTVYFYAEVVQGLQTAVPRAAVSLAYDLKFF